MRQDFLVAGPGQFILAFTIHHPPLFDPYSHSMVPGGFEVMS